MSVCEGKEDYKAKHPNLFPVVAFFFFPLSPLISTDKRRWAVCFTSDQG